MGREKTCFFLSVDVLGRIGGKVGRKNMYFCYLFHGIVEKKNTKERK